MGVHTVSSSAAGSLTAWAVVHNAATFNRDMVLQVQPDARFLRRFKRPRLNAVGDRQEDGFRYEDDLLVLPSMAPGENRWVALTVPGADDLDQPVTVTFHETVGDVAVNGFTLVVRSAPFEVAAAESLPTLGVNLVRLKRFVDTDEAIGRLKELWPSVDKGKIGAPEYEGLLKAIQDVYQSGIKAVLSEELPPGFDLEKRLGVVREALDSGDWELMLATHSDLDRTLDAGLTYLAKREGDVADVAQNMRWQAYLTQAKKSLVELGGLQALAELSTEFDIGYASRRLSVGDYSRYVKRSLPTLERINRELGLGAEKLLERIAANLGRPAGLQAAHRGFLLRLEELP